jgi:hypothetical protein
MGMLMYICKCDASGVNADVGGHYESTLENAKEITTKNKEYARNQFD